MRDLYALLLLLASWIERKRVQIQHRKDQEARDLSERDAVAWFDTEFGADGWVQYDRADATRTDQTHTD